VTVQGDELDADDVAAYLDGRPLEGLEVARHPSQVGVYTLSWTFPQPRGGETLAVKILADIMYSPRHGVLPAISHEVVLQDCTRPRTESGVLVDKSAFECADPSSCPGMMEASAVLVIDFSEPVLKMGTTANPTRDDVEVFISGGLGRHISTFDVVDKVGSDLGARRWRLKTLAGKSVTQMAIAIAMADPSGEEVLSFRVKEDSIVDLSGLTLQQDTPLIAQGSLVAPFESMAAAAQAIAAGEAEVSTPTSILLLIILPVLAGTCCITCFACVMLHYRRRRFRRMGRTESVTPSHVKSAGGSSALRRLSEMKCRLSEIEVPGKFEFKRTSETRSSSYRNVEAASETKIKRKSTWAKKRNSTSSVSKWTERFFTDVLSFRQSSCSGAADNDMFLEEVSRAMYSECGDPDHTASEPSNAAMAIVSELSWLSSVARGPNLTCDTIDGQLAALTDAARWIDELAERAVAVFDNISAPHCRLPKHTHDVAHAAHRELMNGLAASDDLTALKTFEDILLSSTLPPRLITAAYVSLLDRGIKPAAAQLDALLKLNNRLPQAVSDALDELAGGRRARDDEHRKEQLDRLLRRHSAFEGVAKAATEIATACADDLARGCTKGSESLDKPAVLLRKVLRTHIELGERHTKMRSFLLSELNGRHPSLPESRIDEGVRARKVDTAMMRIIEDVVLPILVSRGIAMFEGSLPLIIEWEESKAQEEESPRDASSYVQAINAAVWKRESGV